MQSIDERDGQHRDHRFACKFHRAGGNDVRELEVLFLGLSTTRLGGLSSTAGPELNCETTRHAFQTWLVLSPSAPVNGDRYK